MLNLLIEVKNNHLFGEGFAAVTRMTSVTVGLAGRAATVVMAAAGTFDPVTSNHAVILQVLRFRYISIKQISG